MLVVAIPAPPIVYSAVVVNAKTQYCVPVTAYVTYTVRNNVKVVRSGDVACGSNMTFEGHTYSEGTATFAGIVTKIEAKTASGDYVSMDAPFDVDSPRRNIIFEVRGSGVTGNTRDTQLTLTQISR
ncbi:hypothetical protein Pelo_5360 [Pelomyxa schiedti]|nr:hypothetical protein Pelo_5360 [Pelomyxa schiedti]